MKELWQDRSSSERRLRRHRGVFPAAWRFAAVVLLGLFCGAGCENDDPPDPADALRVEPAEHRFSGNSQTVSLTVINGIPPYVWTVSDARMGVLTGVDPDAQPADVAVVNYTRTPTMSGVNTITVRDARGWSATSRMVAP